jgi:excisionase family DNA binding protein
VDEIGAYLGIKRDTVYKWISERLMPAHRMGRLWQFRKEEVDASVKSGGCGDTKEYLANRSAADEVGERKTDAIAIAGNPSSRFGAGSR